MADAKQQLGAWRNEYNASRPHRALQDRTPEEFAKPHADNDSINDNQQARELTLQVV